MEKESGLSGALAAGIIGAGIGGLGGYASSGNNKGDIHDFIKSHKNKAYSKHTARRAMKRRGALYGALKGGTVGALVGHGIQHARKSRRAAQEAHEAFQKAESKRWDDFANRQRNSYKKSQGSGRSSSGGSRDWEEFFRNHRYSRGSGRSSSGGSHYSSGGGSAYRDTGGSSHKAAKDFFGFGNHIKTKAEAKKHIRAMTKKHHPDMGGSESMMKKVNEHAENIKKSDWFNKLAFLRKHGANRSFLQSFEKVASASIYSGNA